MAANRGFYSTGSKTRARLIDAAYDLLAEEGYVAISARRIAARADVKPQLVHYYFRSMEELAITVFQKSCAVYYRLHDEALSSSDPVRAIWDLNSNLPEAQRMFEYIALARQYPALREEMKQSGENFRALQTEAIRRGFEQRGVENPPVSPEALAGIMSAVARNFVIEGQVGVSSAHAEMRRFIEDLLTSCCTATSGVAE